MNYMELINKIRLYQETMDFKEAVDTAIDSCIANGVLVSFLKNHRAEVLDVCLTEYDEETFVAGIRQEGMEHERAERIRAMIREGCERALILKIGYTEEEYEAALLDVTNS